MSNILKKILTREEATSITLMDLVQEEFPLLGFALMEILVVVSGTGFSSHVRLLGTGMFDKSFPVCAYLLFLFKLQISLHASDTLFRPGSVHSGSVS